MPSPDPPPRAAASRAGARPLLPRAAVLALGLLPTLCAAEKFTFFGAQPDGATIYVQASPPGQRRDGKMQAWFRTVPAAPQAVTDQFGFERRYADFLALNVAECDLRVMGVASLHYRDDKGDAVARFELPAREIEYRQVVPGTLGENMLTWLCAPQPPATPRAPGRLPPSAAGQKPFQ
jgi:hypothetical protein